MKEKWFGVIAVLGMAGSYFWFTTQFGSLSGPIQAISLAIVLGGVMGYLLMLARHREEMKGAKRRFDTLHAETYRAYNQVRELQADVACKHFTPDEGNPGSWLLCGHLEDTGLHRHLEELGRDHRISKRAMKLIKSFAGASCLGTETVKCHICLARAFLEQEKATLEHEKKGGE